MSNPHAYKHGVYKVKKDRVHKYMCPTCKHVGMYYQGLNIFKHRDGDTLNYWYFCENPDCGRRWERDISLRR